MSRTIHLQSPSLTFGRTVHAEWARWLWYIVSDFYSKMTFQKHLRYVSIADSQKLGIWGIPDEYCKISRFNCEMLEELLNTVQQCGVQWPICTWSYCTNHVITIAKFLTGNVLDCNLIDHRSFVTLCMLYNVGSNPMHCFRGAHPEQYVSVRVIHVVLWCLIGILICLLVAELHTTAEHLFLSVYIHGMTSATLCSMVSHNGRAALSIFINIFYFLSFLLQVGCVRLVFDDKLSINLRQPNTT